MVVEILIGALILLGIAAIVISFVMLKKYEDESNFNEKKILEKIATISDEEADKLYSIYDDISKSGESVLRDIDIKYNDLIVLYDMITKKEENLSFVATNRGREKISSYKPENNVAVSNLYDAVAVEKTSDIMPNVPYNAYKDSGVTNIDNDDISRLESLFEKETEAVVFEKKERDRVKLEDKLLATLKESSLKHDMAEDKDLLNMKPAKKDVRSFSSGIKNNKSMNFSGNKKAQEVLRLKDEGMNSTEIAKTLNIGKGEVELILGLGGN